MIKRFLNYLSKNFSNDTQRKYELNLKKQPCVKDSSKLCPKYFDISINGTVRVVNLTQCCKIQDDIKRQSENIAKLDPDVNYNGVRFSKDLIDRCKKRVEEGEK